MPDFEYTITTGGKIHIDQQVIDEVDDGWRSQFYQLGTPEQIAEHLVHNLVTNEASLTALDGFAHLDNSMVKVIEDDDSYEVECHDV